MIRDTLAEACVMLQTTDYSCFELGNWYSQRAVLNWLARCLLYGLKRCYCFNFNFNSNFSIAIAAVPWKLLRHLVQCSGISS